MKREQMLIQRIKAADKFYEFIDLSAHSEEQLQAILEKKLRSRKGKNRIENNLDKVFRE